MYYEPQWAVPHLVAILAAGGLLLTAWLAPKAGRFLYVLLFAWAAWVNWRTALETPWVYVDYAKLAVSSVYRSFIVGPFAHNVLAIVGTIATCQAMIAIGLVLGGPFARFALWGATVFLIAIAPLGVGSGFPSSLLMAGGTALLAGWRRREAIERPLWIEAKEWLHVGRPTPA